MKRNVGLLIWASVRRCSEDMRESRVRNKRWYKRWSRYVVVFDWTKINNNTQELLVDQTNFRNWYVSKLDSKSRCEEHLCFSVYLRLVLREFGINHHLAGAQNRKPRIYVFIIFAQTTYIIIIFRISSRPFCGKIGWISAYSLQFRKCLRCWHA